MMIIVLVGLACPASTDPNLSLGVGRGYSLLIDTDGSTSSIPASTRFSIGITFPIDGFSFTLLPGVNIPDAGIDKARPRLAVALGFGLNENWWVSPSVLYEFIPSNDGHFLAIGTTVGLKVMDAMSFTFSTGPGKLLGLGTHPLPANEGWGWVFQPGLSIKLPAFW